MKVPSSTAVRFLSVDITTLSPGCSASRALSATLALLPLASLLFWGGATLRGQDLGAKFYASSIAGKNALAAALVQAPDGNFYTVHAGNIIQLNPEGVSTVAYNFPNIATGSTNVQGASCSGGLLLGHDGNLYGLTSQGGALGVGTLYQFNPLTKTVQPIASLPAIPISDTFATRYSGAPVEDRAGNFYYIDETTTDSAGTQTFAVIQITPGGTVSTYHTFAALPEGNQPSTALLIDGQDNIYGFTNAGGQGNTGTFYELTPGGQVLALYSYNTNTGSTDKTPAPSQYFGAVVIASDGTVYGTSPFNGGVSGGVGVGTISGSTIFAANGGQPAAIYTFTDAVYQADGSYTNEDGANPGGLTFGPDGNLYGETTFGGANGTGTVFEITPGGDFTLLYTFPPATAAIVPPTLSTDGDIFGICQSSLGTFYRLGATLLPTFNAPTLSVTATQGAPFTLQLVAANDPDTYAAAGLPAGLSLDASTGLITGNATAPLGVYTVNLTATNSDGSSTATLTITVLASPDAPVLTLPKTQPAALTNVPFSYQIDATNHPTYQVKGLPKGVTYDPKTGLIHGIFTHTGEILLQIQAQNASGEASESLKIEVTRLPKVTVSAMDGDAATGRPGSFVFSLSDASGAELVIDYKVGGDAVPGVAYKRLTGVVTIKAGKKSKTISVVPLQALAGEAEKIVKITVKPGTGYEVGTTQPVEVKIKE